jgi:hypothetical protein
MRSLEDRQCLPHAPMDTEYRSADSGAPCKGKCPQVVPISGLDAGYLARAVAERRATVLLCVQEMTHRRAV